MLVKLPYCFYGITARGGGPTRTLILLVISCFSLQILTRSQKSGGGGENSIIIQYSKCKFMKKFFLKKKWGGGSPLLTPKLHTLYIVINNKNSLPSFNFFLLQKLLEKNYYMYFAKIVQKNQTLQFFKQFMHMMHICLFEY